MVVGVSLGLRLRRVVITSENRDGWNTEGYAWFTNRGSALAHAIMYAAGVVWERMHGRESPLDYRYMVQELAIEDDRNVPGAAAAETRTVLRLASLTLRNSSGVHLRVTRALLERDLTDRDIRAIARGERITDSE